MTLIKDRLESVLKKVQKPARYLGNEWNAVHKEHHKTAVKMAFAFPDLYEVGMSNQGLKILYESVNAHNNLLMERVFAPAVDMEAEMRKQNLPLFSLESATPLAEFDLIGFSLQYELSYTNVLNMLDLAGLPLFSSERNDNDPLVIGGGPCSFNPEPLAPFFDLFILGESEEALPALLLNLAAYKESGRNRRDMLKRFSAMAGVYVPDFFDPLYNESGVLERVKKNDSTVPARVVKNTVSNLDGAPYPTAPVVPYIQTVHDRAVVELFRGCARGCRFCQAGYIFRPVRRRSPEKIISIAKDLTAATGYDELSLSSLSSSDYPQVDELIKEIDQALRGDKVRCSLPSLRLDSYSVELADRLHQGRRSSLTFAPEAATERLRKVIKKNISEDDIYTALSDAVAAGWQGFKLYFMIGLPTETNEDVEAIVTMCRDIRDRYRGRVRGTLKLSVSVATFVPKANTPFQWEPQLSFQEIIERQQILIDGFRKIQGIDLSWHDAETSFLEAVFARGDRRLALLLEKAWRLGCRLDGWSEHFSFDLWQQAFKETGINGEAYANRRFSYDDCLPWDHLDCGTDKEYFIREHKLAYSCQDDGGSN
ncbi:MAG: TIGR03960 family B12-binding radical SAM protein [Firmicutes bacterium]|nr:TIGR03960 family B12-binding radical SAM protein [Bacillota bacterium]